LVGIQKGLCKFYKQIRWTTCNDDKLPGVSCIDDDFVLSYTWIKFGFKTIHITQLLKMK